MRNIMKKSIQYLAIAGIMMLGLASCTLEAPEYEPAQPVGNAEVFFAPTLPSSYDLKGNPGTLSIPVTRVQTASSMSASISSTANNIFSVPGSVSFDSGSNTAVLNITFDPSALEEEVEYPFVLTITSDATPYGAAEYSFTASIPAAWIVFGKGTFYECPDWWNEVETKTLYYQEMADGTYMMKIPECFGHDTIEAGNPYNVQDYIFYYDPKTGFCRVPGQYMGYDSSTYGQYWHSDVASFYELYKGPRADGKDWGDYMRENGYYMPWYDKENGIFYLSDQYYYAPEPYSSHWGYGQWDLTPDSFWLDGFVRTIDYNGEKYLGASSALYEGYAESLMLSTSDIPAQWAQSMRYDASYQDDAYDEDGNFDAVKNAGLTTTYYLPDYFQEGYGIAFTAPVPELLEEGSEISDVKNDQNTGLKLFGQDIWFKVKKGSVSFEEDEEFPVFTLVLNVMSKDEEGNVITNFGNIEEVYVAEEYGKDNYTLDDIDGANLSSYLGEWVMQSMDYGDGEEYVYPVTIEYDGQDVGGNYWVKITNLSGYDGLYSSFGGLEDVLYATWDTSYGLLWLYGQDLEKQLTYNGSNYPVKVYPWDPDTDTKYGQGNCLIGGIAKDGALAFVNRYSGVNLCGLDYMLGDLGWLIKVYNIYGFPNTTSSVNSFNSASSFKSLDKEPVQGNCVMLPEHQIKGSAGNRTLAAKKTVPFRTINLNNVVKSPKNVAVPSIAPVK